jgi:hypothetical protein
MQTEGSVANAGNSKKCTFLEQPTGNKLVIYHSFLGILTVNFTMCNILKGQELKFDPSASWDFPFFCELIHGL